MASEGAPAPAEGLAASAGGDESGTAPRWVPRDPAPSASHGATAPSSIPEQPSGLTPRTAATAAATAAAPAGEPSPLAGPAVTASAGDWDWRGAAHGTSQISSAAGRVPLPSTGLAAAGGGDVRATPAAATAPYPATLGSRFGPAAATPYSSYPRSSLPPPTDVASTPSWDADRGAGGSSGGTAAAAAAAATAPLSTSSSFSSAGRSTAALSSRLSGLGGSSSTGSSGISLGQPGARAGETGQGWAGGSAGTRWTSTTPAATATAAPTAASTHRAALAPRTRGHWEDAIPKSPSQVPRGLSEIKARLDAVMAGGPDGSASGAAGREASEPGYLSRRVTELERERAELLGKQAEQLKVVRECLAERTELRQAAAKHKQEMETFQQDVQTVLEKVAEVERQQQDQLDVKTAECEDLRRGTTALTARLTEEQAKAREATTAKEEWQHRAELAASQLSSAQIELDSARARLEASEKRVNAEVKELEEQLSTLRHKRAADLERAEKEVAELKTKNRELQGVGHKHETELLSLRRERDGLKSDLALQAARAESERGGLVNKTRAEAERAAEARAAADRERAATELDRLRESHRAELAKLTESHRAELAELRSARAGRDEEAMARLAQERDQCVRDREGLEFRLSESQAKIQALQAALKAREALNTEQVAQLGSQLESVLKQQYDSVAKAATELTAASKTLSDESRSIVNDVTSELQDVASISVAPPPATTPSSGLGLGGGSAPFGAAGNRSFGNISDRSSARRYDDYQRQPPPRSPLVASLMSGDGAGAAPRGGAAGGDQGAYAPQRPATEHELMQRALSHLGVSGLWPDPRQPESRTASTPSGSGGALLNGLSPTAGGGTGAASASYYLPPGVRDALHPPASPGAARRRDTSPHRKHPPRGRDHSKTPPRKNPGDRDYDKPWLEGIRKKESLGQQAVNDVYRLLRESQTARQRGQAAAPQQKTPERGRKKVWK